FATRLAMATRSRSNDVIHILAAPAKPRQAGAATNGEMGRRLAPYDRRMAIRSLNEGPGRPLGPMAVRSTLPSHTPAEIRAVLRGLPTATGYTVTVKPLRNRSR